MVYNHTCLLINAILQRLLKLKSVPPPKWSNLSLQCYKVYDSFDSSNLARRDTILKSPVERWPEHVGDTLIKCWIAVCSPLCTVTTLPMTSGWGKCMTWPLTSSSNSPMEPGTLCVRACVFVRVCGVCKCSLTHIQSPGPLNVKLVSGSASLQVLNERGGRCQALRRLSACQRLGMWPRASHLSRPRWTDRLLVWGQIPWQQVHVQTEVHNLSIAIVPQLNWETRLLPNNTNIFLP